MSERKRPAKETLLAWIGEGVGLARLGGTRLRKSPFRWVYAGAGVLALGLIIGMSIGIGLGQRHVRETAQMPPSGEEGRRPQRPATLAERLPESRAPEKPRADLAPVPAAPSLPPALPPAVSPGAETPPREAAPVLPTITGPFGPPGEIAPWLRHAQPAKIPEGRAWVAVVIDDLGLDKRRASRTIDLPGPLTMAFMTYAEDLAGQTARARANGHELIVHMPMEPHGEGYDPGQYPLLAGLPAEEIRRRIEWGLSRFSGFVGFNNHMGSRFTSDPAGMAVVIDEARKRGLLFLDSKTSDQSVGAELARRAGIPYAARDVFLDNDPDVAAVRRQLALLEEIARKKGQAIAIGHPRDGTMEALAAWLPTLEAKGLVLVPLTAIVRHNYLKKTGSAGANGWAVTPNG